MHSCLLQDVNDIKDLELIVEQYIVEDRCNWYKTHRYVPWLLFRAFGIATIVLSVSLPFLVNSSGIYKTHWAPVAALSVAALTSLNAFFAWHKSWEKRVRVWLTIHSFIAIWKTQIIEAKRHAKVKKGFQMAFRATQDLIEKTNELEIREAAELSAKFKLNDFSSGKKESRPNSASN